MEFLSPYFFPTTIAFVDDNENFVDSINPFISEQSCLVLSFYSAMEFINFLAKERGNLYPFKEDLSSKSSACSIQESFCLQLPMPYEILYNSRRFGAMSVVVLDYVMPGINGIDLARMLKRSNYFFEVILLTGIGDAELATQAFNEGIISKYIRKDSRHFEALLKDAIKELQLQYFRKLFTKRYLYPYSLPLLYEEAFKQLIENMVLEKNVVEYYIVDMNGSTLFVNQKGELSYLHIISNEILNSFLELAEMEDAHVYLRNILHQKTHMPIFDFPSDKLLPSTHQWIEYLVKCEKLEIREGYYYSFIAPINFFSLLQEKITTFYQSSQNSKKFFTS